MFDNTGLGLAIDQRSEADTLSHAKVAIQGSIRLSLEISDYG